MGTMKIWTTTVQRELGLIVSTHTDEESAFTKLAKEFGNSPAAQAAAVAKDLGWFEHEVMRQTHTYNSHERGVLDFDISRHCIEIKQGEFLPGSDMFAALLTTPDDVRTAVAYYDEEGADYELAYDEAYNLLAKNGTGFVEELGIVWEELLWISIREDYEAFMAGGDESAV